MYNMKTDSIHFESWNSDLIISLKMDNKTGHIVAETVVFAGSRGSLHFNFDLDQTFLPELMEDVEVIRHEDS